MGWWFGIGFEPRVLVEDQWGTNPLNVQTTKPPNSGKNKFGGILMLLGLDLSWIDSSETRRHFRCDLVPFDTVTWISSPPKAESTLVEPANFKFCVLADFFMMLGKAQKV